MKASMSFVVVFFLLFGCGTYSSPGSDAGSDPVPVDDGAPGPADDFVGVWQGSGSETTSGVGGEWTMRDFEGSVTISRLSSAVVQLEFRDFDDEFDCGIVNYDVGAGHPGQLRKNQTCWAQNIFLKNGTLTLSGALVVYDQTTPSESQTISESATLRRVP